VLVLAGPINERNKCKKILNKWIKLKAKKHLVDLLNVISQNINLPFLSVSIRNQRSLWGSCTVDRAINLNFKLLFLPHAVARHVIIHELCHTKFLNHSADFWNLVSRYDEAWKINKRQLRHGENFIPAWVE
jgi:predicted metal-dependent hydrolase